MKHLVLLATFMSCLWLVSLAAAQDEVFSGPQPGEALPPFTVQGVFDDEAGKQFDFVTAADGKPILLVFVHELNRPSIAMTRVISQYTSSRSNDGLATGVVFLFDDKTEGESTLKRIRHALARGAPTGISIDGREGPGSYGLNRNVTLTILVAKDNEVTANFALVQPSLQTDLPQVLESVVEVAGGEVPKLEDLDGMRQMMRVEADANGAPNLRPLLAPLIRRTASPDDVDRIALLIEQRAGEDVAVRREIARITNTIIEAGKLENYGTPRAQEYLKKWAKLYRDKSQNSERGDNGADDEREEPESGQ